MSLQVLWKNYYDIILIKEKSDGLYSLWVIYGFVMFPGTVSLMEPNSWETDWFDKTAEISQKNVMKATKCL